jgi:RNA polymerase sigma factor (sigma-70 family)
VQPTKQEVKSLVEGCLRNDRRSQQRVYEAHYGKMLSVCLRYDKDLDSAKELLQEAFIKVFANIDRYKHDGSFEGWIRRIVVNNAIDAFRRKKNDFIVPENDYMINNFSEDPVDFDEEDEEVLNPKDVLAAMEQLSPAYKMVFNMYIMEEMPHKEIADQLGISVGTSKSNLAKARVNIRKILRNQYSYKF